MLATDPPDGAFGVTYPLTGTFYFSEKMNKRSVERDLRIYPEPDFLRIEWEGGTLTDDSGERVVELLHVTLDRDDRAGARPTMITVGGGSEDRRKNAIEEPVTLAFTNGGAPMPRGRLSGLAEGVEKKRSGREEASITVEAYRVPPAESGESADAHPYTITSAGRDGHFQFRYLPLPPERVHLRLYRDDDQDGAINREIEYYGFSDTLSLSEEGDSVTIQMVNANTPATLKGTLLWASPESLRVEITLTADSLPPESVAPDSTGTFSFRKLTAGAYEFRVLRPGKGVGGDSALEVLDSRSLDLAPGEEQSLPAIGPPTVPDTQPGAEEQEPQVKE